MNDRITIAEHEAAVLAARHEERAETELAIAADRTRMQGIVNLPEATGREALARRLACGTSMSVEDARAVLAAA